MPVSEQQRALSSAPVHRPRFLHLAALFIALLAMSVVAAAAPIGTRQTFDGDVTVDDYPPESCTECIINGWQGSLVPFVGADGGDNAIGNGAFGFGLHQLTWQGYPNADEAFLGDYLSAGVVAVRVDIRYVGDGAGGAPTDDLFLRAFLISDDDVLLESAVSKTGAEILTTATAWTTYTIPIAPDDLMLGQANDTDASIEDILSSIGQFGLRHDPGGEGPTFPDRVNAELLYDNIQLVLVPIPGAVWLFGGALGLLGLVGRRRRRRQ